MRRRQLKWLWARLTKLAAMDVSTKERPMKLGARALQGALRLAPRRRRARRKHRRAELRAQSRQAASRPPPRRPLSVAIQSDRKRSGAHLALLHSTRRGGGGVQDPQRRPRDPPDLPSRRTAHRSPYLRRLPRLLPPGHLDPPPARPRARPHRPKRAREVRRRSATCICPQPTGARSSLPAPPNPSRSFACSSTASTSRCRPSRPRIVAASLPASPASVVKTF